MKKKKNSAEPAMFEDPQPYVLLSQCHLLQPHGPETDGSSQQPAALAALQSSHSIQRYPAVSDTVIRYREATQIRSLVKKPALPKFRNVFYFAVLVRCAAAMDSTGFFSRAMVANCPCLLHSDIFGYYQWHLKRQ